MKEQFPEYKSIAEIRSRKDLLLDDIRKDDEQIRILWSSLFHKPVALTASTPSRRFSGLMSAGAGVLDGLLLGWKLYRKFNGKSSSSFSLFSKKRNKR